jgi:hypothetical protein
MALFEGVIRGEGGAHRLRHLGQEPLAGESVMNEELEQAIAEAVVEEAIVEAVAEAIVEEAVTQAVEEAIVSGALDD